MKKTTIMLFVALTCLFLNTYFLTFFVIDCCTSFYEVLEYLK